MRKTARFRWRVHHIAMRSHTVQLRSYTRMFRMETGKIVMPTQESIDGHLLVRYSDGAAQQWKMAEYYALHGRRVSDACVLHG